MLMFYKAAKPIVVHVGCLERLSKKELEEC